MLGLAVTARSFSRTGSTAGLERFDIVSLIAHFTHVSFSITLLRPRRWLSTASRYFDGLLFPALPFSSFWNALRLDFTVRRTMFRLLASVSAPVNLFCLQGLFPDIHQQTQY